MVIMVELELVVQVDWGGLMEEEEQQEEEHQEEQAQEV
jgi:hypothetical protein